MNDADVRLAGARDGFRPDLEGLRAVAVALVVLYHAGVPGFSGGYVGVDVFFVLSGFLITGLLLREVRRSGTISLSAFYARRARRLLPASALVLLVTVVASFVLLPPLQVPPVAGDTAAAALYVSNMRFAFQATDYLQAELAPSPLLHFWSLGVEEQFYVFWPAIVLLVARARIDATRRVAIAAGIISVVSFCLALWLTGANAPWAFFSLPTRAWELGLGAFLAIGAVRLARIPERPAAAVAWTGLGLVTLSGVILGTETPFPGTAALLPTVGSALVIAGGFRQSAVAPGRWLSMSAPRFLGRISYSLYLWHWPLLVLPAAALGGPLPWWARGALVLAAIGLAAATQRWVEDPLRHGTWIGTLPRRNLAMAGALSVVVATASLGLAATTMATLQSSSASSLTGDEQQLDQLLDVVDPSAPRVAGAPDAPAGTPGRPAAGRTAPPTLPPTPSGPLPATLRPSLAEVRDDLPELYGDGCHLTQEEVVSPPCEYGRPDGTPTVVLFGDSHAASWFPAVDRLASERGWRLVSLTKSSCSSVDVAQWNVTLKRAYTECDAWRASSYARIVAEHPSLVLLANDRTFVAAGPDGAPLTDAADRAAAWRDGMTRTLAGLAPAAAAVVVIGDTPRSSHDVPVCLSAHGADTLACATPLEQAVDLAWLGEERAAAERGGVGFVDPTPWVCPSTPCPAVVGSFMVLRDEHHLTTPFSRALAARLGDTLARLGAMP